MPEQVLLLFLCLCGCQDCRSQEWLTFPHGGKLFPLAAGKEHQAGVRKPGCLQRHEVGKARRRLCVSGFPPMRRGVCRGVCCLVAEFCLILCDLMDRSTPGISIKANTNVASLSSEKSLGLHKYYMRFCSKSDLYTTCKNN